MPEKGTRAKMSKIMSRFARICVILCAAAIFLLPAAACSGGGEETASENPFGVDIPVLNGKETFALSSGDLHDGVWDTVITNTVNGENVSPQLSWEPVDGAECYAIYMVDTSANCWIHWKSGGVTET